MISPTLKCFRKNNLRIYTSMYIQTDAHIYERDSDRGNGTKYKPLVI